MEVISLILGFIILIVFFVMTNNIGAAVRILREIHRNQVGIVSSLDKIKFLLAGGKETLSVEDKAKAYDAIEAAKKKLQ